MTSKKKNKSKHKKKKGNHDNADDSLRILLQDEALVYCKMENYEKAIRQYTAVNIYFAVNSKIGTVYEISKLFITMARRSEFVTLNRRQSC